MQGWVPPRAAGSRIPSTSYDFRPTMSLTQTSQQLDRLAAITPGAHPIVTLYLKLEPRDRARGKYLIKLKNRMRTALDGLAAMGFSPAEQRLVAADLDRIYRDLETPAGLPPTQGIAFFASEGLGLYERVELPMVYRSRLVVDRTPLIRELLAAHDEVGRLLTVVMDRTSARIFEVTAYGAKEVADIRSEATRGGKFHSDRHGAPGMGEHTYHNRIRNEKKRHLGAIAEALFRLDRAAPAHGFILAGIGTDAASLTPFLHPYLKGKVMGTARLNPKETSAAHVHAATLAARAQAEQESEAALVKQVRSGLGTGWAVNGVAPTLKALAEGKVRTLLVDPSVSQPGFRCASGRLALQEKDCRAEGPCVPVYDILDDAIEEALRQRVEVDVIHSEAAARIDGLAALLRFK